MPKHFHPTRRFSTSPNHAALTIAFGDHFPAGCNAHIFPDGAFRTDDGRPASLTKGDVKDWQMNAAIADRLIAALAEGKPILYDYEHNSLYGDSRAAGWIDALAYVAGRGLFAHVAWTPDAAEAIANKEYCYSSPFFKFDGTGEVTKLISVALTNNPALDALGAVDLTKDLDPPTNQGGPEMTPAELAALTSERESLKTDVVALSVERDNLKTQAAALTIERDALAAKVTAAEKEKTEAALAADQAKHAEVLSAALTDGRLTPAQKPWAEKQNLAALTEYLDATQPLPLTQTQVGGTGENVALTAEEVAMCARMGVSHEDYRKAKTPL